MKLINYLERFLISHIKLYICFVISWITVNVVMIISSFCFIENELLKWGMFGSALLTLAVVIPSNIIYRRLLKANT